MALRKSSNLQGSRGYHMVELAQRGVDDKPKTQPQPESKCSKGKPQLKKEHRQICNNDISKPCLSLQDAHRKTNNICLPIAKRRYSSTQTGTDSSHNILTLPNDSLSMIVDDPELLDIISSLKESESGVQSEVDNGDIYKKTVQDSNKTAIQKSCDDSTAKISLSECTVSEKENEKSDLANYFKNFTTNKSITIKPDEIHTCPSSILFSLSQEIEIESSEVNTTLRDLQEIDFTEPNSNTTANEQNQAQLSLQNETYTCIAENENNSYSMSVLIGNSEPQNQVNNLEIDPTNYEDTSDNAVDQEWVPGNDDKLTSDTDVTDAEGIAGDQNVQHDTILHNIENGKVKKNRKRVADPSEWNDIKNKKRRECGEAYKGWTKQKGEKAKRGAERSERKLEPACISDNCKKTRDCQKVLETEREFIFNFFWKKMSWDQKKVYVASLVTSETPKRRTTGDSNTSRRNTSFAYSLKTSDGKVFKVCKKMFLSTLGLNEWMVTNWIKSSKGGMSESTKERNTTRQIEHTATNSNRKNLEDFLDKLPKLPSHYCRKSTSKTYLEPTFRNSMTEIYKEYVKECAASNPPQKSVSRFTFDAVVKEKNIGFQPPKKDRCDLCISYETGNIEEEAYQNHLAKKEKARDEKRKKTKVTLKKEFVMFSQWTCKLLKFVQV